MSKHEDFELPSKEQARQKVRAEFPACAAIVDEFQAVFGKVTVLAMKEGERQHKIKNYTGDDGFLVLNAAQYERLGKISEQNKKFVEGNLRGKRK